MAMMRVRQLCVRGVKPLACIPRTFSAVPSDEILKGYGDHLFSGAVADNYLAKQGLPAGTMTSPAWTRDRALADKVAAGVLQWATDNGASMYCHWFQPMGASGVRHGLTAMVQSAFFKFDDQGKPVWNLTGKDLLKGETDGSSYPSGGLRATHRAGGYLVIDPTSNIFLRGDTIFLPACFVSYYGHSLDEKTPLLKSVDAMNKQGVRLLKLLGYQVEGLVSNIGLEQEFFLVPRDAYQQRPDLMLAGRTLIGKDAPRGQEMCDHYMGAPSSGSNAALECMKEIQAQCYKMGIPLRTRHREVAPNQYEFAPLYGFVTTQIDQNLMVMQVMEEVASHYGLACLMQEKPFNNINGSGKHNNWSICTTCGTNLLNVKELAEKSGSSDIFPVIMSALVSGVDTHGDILRMAIASPGNDFRLGACEAPPAILSTYLGTDLTTYLDSYRQGNDAAYKPNTKTLNLSIKCVEPFEVPSEDRNRTSPLPYGGHRFEFRAVGSSQNVSLVNTALNLLAADSFKNFADAIEGGQQPRDVATSALNKHWKVIFNGNNYDTQVQQELTDKGVWRIDSGVDAICRFTADKTKKLFGEHGVLTSEECDARQTVTLEHYIGTVDLEANCLVDMLNQDVIPSLKNAAYAKLDEVVGAVPILNKALTEMDNEEDVVKKAKLARVLRLETMVELREVIDAAEGAVPAELWKLASYNDLLFLDQTS